MKLIFCVAIMSQTNKSLIVHKRITIVT